MDSKQKAYTSKMIGVYLRKLIRLNMVGTWRKKDN